MKKFSKINESKQELFEDICIGITDALGVNPRISMDDNDSYEFYVLRWNMKIYKGASIEVNEQSIKLIEALQELPTIQKRVPGYKMNFKIEELYFQINFLKYKKSSEEDLKNKKYNFISGEEFKTIFIDTTGLVSWLLDRGYKVRSMENEQGESGGEGCFLITENGMSNEHIKEFEAAFGKEMKEKLATTEIHHDVVVFINSTSIEFTPSDDRGYVEFNQIL
jgi:hypothetical protein